MFSTLYSTPLPFILLFMNVPSYTSPILISFPLPLSFPLLNYPYQILIWDTAEQSLP